MSRLLSVWAVLLVVGCTQPPQLTAGEHNAVNRRLQARGLSAPSTIVVRADRTVVATYLMDDRAVEQLPIPLRDFAERRLLTIREALIPFGYTDYRVNLNGLPGTGLKKRYGSAQLMTVHGAVEWIQ